jgi:HPt (histidine-containing phosphotransfer) domain-containing protein
MMVFLINFRFVYFIRIDFIFYADRLMGMTSVTPHLTGDDPVNLEGLHQVTDGDAEAEKELTAIFVEQGDTNLLGLQANCRGGQHVMWTEIAHMLKGSAANMGAFQLSQLCDEAETITDSADERGRCFLKIEAEYLRVKEFFKKIGLMV